MKYDLVIGIAFAVVWAILIGFFEFETAWANLPIAGAFIFFSRAVVNPRSEAPKSES